MLSDSQALLYDVTHLAAGRTAPPFLGAVPGVRQPLDPGPEWLRRIPLLIPASTLVPTGPPEQIPSPSACPCSGSPDASASPSLPAAGGLQAPSLAPWGPWSTPGRCADLPGCLGLHFCRSLCTVFLKLQAARPATRHGLRPRGACCLHSVFRPQKVPDCSRPCVLLLPLLSANPLPPPGHSMSGKSLSALWACLSLGAATIRVHV